ncbi:hypothetical protein EJB05_09167 [Eragrostis curvula]|uniref:Uncharacterized protein n=1 Tax=Eragrostis curvula TaxID=38414 RepID=A0A5J9W484_9POAL|nr:hypothetical protein EJB05_09167 [Eragrostis curvula]
MWQREAVALRFHPYVGSGNCKDRGGRTRSECFPPSTSLTTKPCPSNLEYSFPEYWGEITQRSYPVLAATTRKPSTTASRWERKPLSHRGSQRMPSLPNCAQSLLFLPHFLSSGRVAAAGQAREAPWLVPSCSLPFKQRPEVAGTFPVDSKHQISYSSPQSARLVDIFSNSGNKQTTLQRNLQQRL